MKKVLIIILVILVIMVLAFMANFGFFLVTYYDWWPHEEKAIQADFSSTKTYRNSQYGFQFEYPSNLILTQRNNVQNLKYSEIYLVEKKKVSGVLRKLFPFANEYTENILLTILASKNSFNLDAQNTENITINNVKFKKYTSNDANEKSHSENSLTYVAEGNLIVINTMVKNEKFVEQLLSTFKFTK